MAKQKQKPVKNLEELLFFVTEKMADFANGEITASEGKMYVDFSNNVCNIGKTHYLLNNNKPGSSPGIQFFTGGSKQLGQSQEIVKEQENVFDNLKVEINFNKSTQTWFGHYKEYPTVKAIGVTEDECKENLSKKLAAHLKD